MKQITRDPAGGAGRPVGRIDDDERLLRRERGETAGERSSSAIRQLPCPFQCDGQEDEEILHDDVRPGAVDYEGNSKVRVLLFFPKITHLIHLLTCSAVPSLAVRY